MATEVKRRRGTTAQHQLFEGVEAELTVDTDKWTVLVHDDSGSAPTGHELLRQDFSNVTTLKVDTTYSETGNEVQGEMYWNDDEETVSLITNGARLDLGHALEFHVKVTQTGGVSKGDVVRAAGAVGGSGKIEVAKFQAGTHPVKTIVGIMAEDVAVGEFGKAIAFGKVRGIDMSSFTAGDILYASTTAGELTNTAPSAGSVSLPIAYVVDDAINTGEIFVRVTPIDENAYQAYDADLSTIAGLAKTDGNFIVGNGSAWVAESGTTARTSLGLGNVEDVALSTYTGEGGSLDNQYITNGAGYVTQTDTDSLYDDYDYWTLTVGTTNQNITSQSALTLTAGDNVSLEIDGANVTISSSLPTGAIDTITTSNTSGLSSSESSGEVTLNLALGNLTAMTATPDAQEAIAILEGSTTKKIALGSIPLTAFDNTSSGFISDYTVTQADVTQHQSALAIAESQITFTSSFIELADLSVATEPASGGGSLSYDNTQGLFTFTPASIPDVSSFIDLTDLSVGIPDSPSGSGAISYSSANGVFTYTPPDLSGYLTAHPSISAASSVDNSGVSVIQDVTLDGNGHVTGLTSKNLVNEFVPNNANLVVQASASGGGSLTYDTSTKQFTYTPPAAATGDITEIKTNTNSGLNGGTTSGVATLSFNISNLVDMTEDVEDIDQIAILDGTTNKRKALSEIDISVFNNDAGFLTSQISHADVVVDGDFAANGLMKRTGAGTYTTITDSSSDWSTAYSRSLTGTTSFNTGTGVLTLNQQSGATITQDLDGRYLPLSGGTMTGTLVLDGVTYHRVSAADNAYQRSDARDDATNYARLHWYGVTDAGATSNFRHAWYDGSNYVTVTANSGGSIDFGGSASEINIGSDRVLTTADEGNGNGLDADTLDGQHGSYYTNATNLTSGTLNADRLPWATNDGFSGTYSLVWRATNTPYTASWLQVRGSDDSLLTRNIIADGNIEADDATFSGNVGIGTTSPSANLQVVREITTTGIEYPLIVSGQDAGNNIDQGTGSGIGIKFEIAGNDTAGDSLVGASIVAMRESASDANSSTGLAFLVSQNDTTLDEAVRINENGNVGIGTSSPDNKLHVESGTTNLVAKFISSDDTAQIQISDNDTTTYLGSKNGLSYISQTGGTPADGLCVDSSGNVGIGTTSPAHKLDVAGTVRAGTSTYRTSLDGNSGGARVYFGSTSDIDLLGTVGAYSSLFNIDSGNGPISFKLAGSEKMRIDSSGNVGIGTTTPSAKVHLHHTSEEVLRIDSGNTGAIHFFEGTTRRGILGYSNGTSISGNADAGDIVLRSESTKKLHLANGGTVALTVDTNENVGIGTTSPSASFKLDVNGAGRFVNDLYADEDLVVSDYIFRGNRQTASIWARGTGYNNSANRTVYLNGTAITDSTGRGLRLDIFNSDLTHNSGALYDTYASSTASTNLATAMNNMTRGQFGVLTSFDAWEGQVNNDLRASALRHGLTKLAKYSAGGSRRPYVAIFKGIIEATGVGNSEVIEIMTGDSASDNRALLYCHVITDGQSVGFMGSTSTNALYSANGDEQQAYLYLDSSNDLIFDGNHVYLNNNVDIDGDFYTTGEVGGGTLAIDVGGTFGGNVGITRSANEFITLTRSGIRTWEQQVDSGGHFYIRNVTGSNNVITLTDDNNVGISNTAPAQKLDVNGNIRGYGSIRVNAAATGSPYFALYQDNNEKAYIQYEDSGDLLAIQSDGGHRFLSGGSTERMRIHSNGDIAFRTISQAENFFFDSSETRLGIGNAAPDYTLDLYSGGSTTTARIAGLNSSASAGYLRVSGYSASGTEATIGEIDFTNQASVTDAVVSSIVAIKEGTLSTDAGELQFKTKPYNGSLATNMTITGAGNVGIGTTSPANKLDVAGTVRIQSTGTATLILDGDTNNSGDAGETDSIIDMRHDAGAYGMRLSTRNFAGRSAFKIQENIGGSFSDRFTIDENGNTCIGAGSPNASNALNVYHATSDAPLRVQSGDTHTGITFQDNNATNHLFYYGSQNHFYFNGSGVTLGVGVNSITTTNLSLDVENKVRASGIMFGTDTADANTLDDYEEGTWIPEYNSSSAEPISVTYSSARAGRYIKVGNVVHVWGRIETNTLTWSGTTGAVYVEGLPFTVTDVLSGPSFYAGCIGYATAFAGEEPKMLGIHGTERIYLYYHSSTTSNISNLSPLDLNSGTGENDLMFQITYRTD